MQQLEIVIATATPKGVPTQTIQAFFRHWLTDRRGLVIGGVAIVAGWHWDGIGSARSASRQSFSRSHLARQCARSAPAQ